MRARKITMTVVAAAVLALPAVSMAKLQGQCGDCHTMHNSYRGLPVAKTFGVSGLSQTPNPVLLKMDCLSCHAQGAGATKIVHLSGGSDVPQVFHNDPTGDLAAGNFAYVTGLKTSGQVSHVNYGDGSTASLSRKGHNPRYLTTADDSLTVPPGFSRGPENGYNISSTWHPANWGTARDVTYPGGNQVNCAGYMGCHGLRNELITVGSGTTATVWRQGLDAITGAHHINDPEGLGKKDVPELETAMGQITYAGTEPNQTSNIANYAGEVIAKSYRFLWGVAGYGNQNSKWQNASASDHNEYYGKSTGLTAGATMTGGWAGATGTWVDYADVEMHNSAETCERCHEGGHGATPVAQLKAPDHTMSGFCGTCHAKFHTTGPAGTTAFVRHPSDYTIQNKTEYAAIAGYSITAPVARPTVYDAADAGVTLGTDMVMCLSCHEAHATPYDSMLRFDYTKMVAGNAAGPDQDTGCFACHTAKDTGSLPTR